MSHFELVFPELGALRGLPRIELSEFDALADFAKDAAIPGFLQQGLQGNPAECRRVSSLADSAADAGPIFHESF